VNDRSVERSHVDALIVEAQRLLTNYLSKQTERPTLSTICFGLFSGPAQREAQRLALISPEL
jgi:hypothetical protein